MHVFKGDQRGYKPTCRLFAQQQQGPSKALSKLETHEQGAGVVRAAAQERQGEALTSLARRNSTRCFSGAAQEPCQLCWTSWPVLRISRRLAQAIVSAFDAGATGHHEAITGAVCKRRTWCTREQIRARRLSAYFLGGEPGFKRPANSSNRMTVHGINKYIGRLQTERGVLYHPAKCQADPSLGAQQMSASQWI
mmetsp:Transcript_54296/g.125063  ORF Transcript_54296/g.125063 Transcript_54296/m.125063 type:complete len:194 (-) Transcript_54296:135-716(-)